MLIAYFLTFVLYENEKQAGQLDAIDNLVFKDKNHKTEKHLFSTF